jgi:hypothetical protein
VAGPFLARRLDGLGDDPRPGVPRTITDAQVEEVVIRTLGELPEGAARWSKRELAARVGISPDPLLLDKIRDVVGLYLAPPANAAVFGVDEKPQIQPLQRTAPVLPMIPGVPERRSHDYVRHGTIRPVRRAEDRHRQGDRQAVRPAALEDWIRTWNAIARPFKWTKTADQIIDRICRYCSRICGPAH